VRPGSRAIADGIIQAGIDFVVHLPDSTLWEVPRLLTEEPGVTVIACTREDEGMAIAAGAFLTGRFAVTLMEGSGVGYSALILARLQVQRSPILIVASHSPALGERNDYHAATRVVASAVLGGLGIPFVIASEGRRLTATVVQAAATARGQRTPVAVLVPDFVMDESAA